MFSPTTVMFIPFLAIGVILIVASLLMRKKTESTRDEISDETITVAINQQIEKSITDADNAMEQLNRMSSMILDELENKYKELLFLYQLIDDKKIEVEQLISETLYLNDIVQNNQMRQPTYLTAPGIIDGYHNPYYESQPVYPNTKYNNNTDADVKPAKAAGGNLFESEVPVVSDELAQPTELKYSSERLPAQYVEKSKEIIKLTSEGKTPSEIAQHLNMGQGEIKLILTLAKVRHD